MCPMAFKGNEEEQSFAAPSLAALCCFERPTQAQMLIASNYACQLRN